MISSEPADRGTSVAATPGQRRLWCGDCRSTEVFDEIRQADPAAVEMVGIDLLCTACGAAYFADFHVDGDAGKTADWLAS